MENKYLSQIKGALKDNNEENQKNNIVSNFKNLEDTTANEEIPIKKVSNNFDDMPVKGGSNFNELLEREMSKEGNIGSINNEMNQNVEPRFKYIPKKRKDIVSIPSNTKKYKYYSDNFESKKKKKEKNDDNNNDMNINNFKNQKKNSNSSYKKSKEKEEKYDFYEKNNNIKENQNKKNPKIIDRKLDFDDFKQNQNSNPKKKKIHIT